MADLVSEESEFSCNFCTSKLKLGIASSCAKGKGKKIGNQTNSFFAPPGGNCTFPPNVPPSPCPGIPPGGVVSTGQSTVKVDGQTALGDGCKFMCPKAQQVALSKAGQEVAKHNEAVSAMGVLVAGTTLAVELPIPVPQIKLGAAVAIVAGAVVIAGGVAVYNYLTEDSDSSTSDDSKTAEKGASAAPPPNDEEPPEKEKSHQQKKNDRYKENIDNHKEHLTRRDLDAARRELDGETVATKRSGEAFDHVKEVRDSQNGLRNTINSIKQDLTRPGLSAVEKQQLESSLSEASKMLDFSKQFVP